MSDRSTPSDSIIGCEFESPWSGESSPRFAGGQRLVNHASYVIVQSLHIRSILRGPCCVRKVDPHKGPTGTQNSDLSKHEQLGIMAVLYAP